MPQISRHTHVPYVPWSPKMTIRKPSVIPTPTQGYQKNPNEMIYRMEQLSGTKTRSKQSKKRKKNAIHMKQNVPTSLKTTIRNQYAWSVPIQDHHDVLTWMLHRYVPLKGKNKREMKSYWQKEKPAKTTRNSPRPLHVIPTKEILLPNTLNTSNIQYIKASINQNSQRPNIRSSNDSRRRKTVERAKIDGFFEFFSTVIQRYYRKPTTTIP